MARVMTKISEGGRIVIPAEYRKALEMDVGDMVILLLEEGVIRILTPHEAIRRAQSAVRAYIPEGSRLSDELIADRRREARSE
jgi:AbrB family looped-hinge helix DNA binding protein